MLHALPVTVDPNSLGLKGVQISECVHFQLWELVQSLDNALQNSHEYHYISQK